jgi:hypothetical protein
MARRDIQIGEQIFTTSPLESPPIGNRHCALMRVALLDEMTGRAPSALVAARLTAPTGADARLRVVHEGLIGVAGEPSRAFAPLLATTGRIEMDIWATRFAPRHLAVTFACRLRMLASAAAATVLKLSSNANLIAGQRLLIGAPDGSRAEYAVIQALGPLVNEVTLAQPIGFPYPAGSPVQPLPADQTVELHRAPVTVAGRILKNGGATQSPLANAQVFVSKLWRQLPPAGTVVDPDPPVAGAATPMTPWDPPIAALSPPAYADIPLTGTLVIEDRAVDAAVTAKALLDDVVAGAASMRLADAAGLVVGDVIAIDADDDGRREIHEVDTIAPSGGATDWARITIRQELALTHGRGRLVRRLKAPAVPTTIALNYGVAAGDAAVLFDASGITGTHQVCLVDPGPPVVHAFQRIDILTATSDADGFYRLPPISRAGKIEIFAQDSNTPANGQAELVPDYASSANRVDIVVS